MSRAYQISIQKGRYRILIFRGDHHNEQKLSDVHSVDEALERLRGWIRDYRWGAGPCRLRNLDTNEWRELGVVGE